ncbi:MAG: efflux RND transporter periplasmic adaptor subunit [Anaeromicrobium sp.]|jgi:RND family efflux transporter MFP subunit|uniref:efflux RND transporter periplasmic adaptor subunit n=1 Tax=Anaeromicrobium sp. TaxID=1929132 RepID=UPI0025F39651|nr:efflux RND transporter periplasmic adaptor subunit [Anaeromicrobium sp.]MCT4595155.1 efflux RND transporter periplasmic adaptor subunit [Anaeromicrobium sp.]
MIKKILGIIMVSTMLLSLSACAKADGMKKEEKVRAVKVQKIEETKNSVSLGYIGTVDSKSIIDYSFKTGGKLAKVHVKKGDKVKKGNILAELDKEDINLQLEAAKANLVSAEENVKKARDAMNYQEDQFSRMEKLYEASSLSKSQYEQIKLQRDASVATYNQAKSQYDATRVNYENTLIILEESTIYAKEDGIVVAIPHEEGERIAPPAMSYVTIVQVRSMDQIINVGIAQKDLNKIHRGIKATINIDGEMANGLITNIDEAPNQATRTYNGEVYVKDKNYRLGSIAKVSFHVGEENGVWIPMQSIFSNGEDYVYIVKEDRAFKRTVTLLKNNEDKVMIKGVKPGELLAISGMKNLNDGSKVNIVE